MTERYQRHSLIDWFDQQKLRDAQVVVVGAGAVGNEVLKNLALLGLGNIHIFDFDRIEEHNLTKCVLFRDADVGRYKAEIAAESCHQLDPNVDIRASCVDFWEALSLGEIANADSVICCVDNLEARVNLNRLCMMMGTDLYNTGIDSRYAVVEMFPFSTNPDCACYECALPPSAYSAIQRRYSCGWLRKVAFDERKLPTTVVTSAMAGSVAVSLMLNRLNQHPQAIHDAVRLFQDTISLEATLSVVQRNEVCPACNSIDSNPTHIATKRFCSNESVIPLIGDATGEITLSEPVLIRGVCKICNRRQDYFESVHKLTDAITFCSICGARAVEIEVVEGGLTPECFRQLFAGRNVPCKYLKYNAGNRQIILEMEE